MLKLFLLFFLLFFICCRQSSINKEQVSLKDSVLRKYLAAIDSLDYYDTTNQDYRVLRAYANNEDEFFISMKKEIDLRSQYIYSPGLDSCLFPKKISDLAADEVYRFIYRESFCIFGLAITISRTGDSIQLHYAKYILGEQEGRTEEVTFKNGDHYFIKPHCQLIKELDKPLQIKHWDELMTAIQNAEYWGLRQYYEPSVIRDGSFWQIDAYTKRPRYPDNRQVQSVFRHSPKVKAFRELCILFIKLSGEKTTCGELF
jgi:hypothetical protein